MTQPVKPRTVAAYHRVLTSFYNWMVHSGAIASSPMVRVAVPKKPKDKIQPFTDEQICAVEDAARRGSHPAWDFAVVFFMLDTGARASAVCSIRVKDVDLTTRRVQIRGKGGKVWVQMHHTGLTSVEMPVGVQVIRGGGVG